MKTITMQVTCELRYNSSPNFIQKKNEIAVLLMKNYPVIQQDDLSKIVFASRELTSTVTVTSNNTIFSFPENTDYVILRKNVELIWKDLSRILNISIIDRLGIRMMELYPQSGVTAVAALSKIFNFKHESNIIEANCNFVYTLPKSTLRVSTSNHIHQKFDPRDNTNNYQIMGTMLDIDSFTFKVMNATLSGVMQDLITQKDLVLNRYE